MRRHVVLALGLVVPLSGNAAVLDIATFRAHPPDRGIAEIVGYIVGKYACPPCPPPAQCKPCPGDSVTIADDAGSGTEAGLVVFCPAAALPAFEPGRRYRLEVDIRAVRSAAPFAGELHLRAARPEGAR